jgi:HSP20 family protein
MANVVRWDPFREMMQLRRSVDRMLDEATMNGSGWDEPMRWALPVDVIENEDAYVIKASLPGVKPEDINITYDNRVLTLSAEYQADEEKKDERYLLRERRYGSFSRSLTLSNLVDSSKIEANYEDGVLTLRLPKSEEVKPRRIPIQGRKAIEG